MKTRYVQALSGVAKNVKRAVSESSAMFRDKELAKSIAYRFLPKSLAVAYSAFGLSDPLLPDFLAVDLSGQAYADECGLVKMPGDDCVLSDDRSEDAKMLSTDKQEYKGHDTVLVSGSLESDREYFVGVLSPEDKLIGWAEVTTDADGLYRNVPVFDFYPDIDGAGRYVVGVCLDEECLDNVRREVRYDP